MKKIIKSAKKTKAKTSKNTVSKTKSKNVKSLAIVTKRIQKSEKKINDKLPTKFYPTDLAKCRKTLTTILNWYHNSPDASTVKVRTEIRLLSAIINCFKIEKEISIESRLDSLEENIGLKNVSNNEEALL